MKKTKKKTEIGFFLFNAFLTVVAISSFLWYSFTDIVYKAAAVFVLFFVPLFSVKLVKNYIVKTAIVLLCFTAGFLILKNETVYAFLHMPLSFLVLFSDSLSKKNYTEGKAAGALSMSFVVSLVALVFVLLPKEGGSNQFRFVLFYRFIFAAVIFIIVLLFFGAEKKDRDKNQNNYSILFLVLCLINLLIAGGFKIRFVFYCEPSYIISWICLFSCMFYDRIPQTGKIMKWFGQREK